MLHGHLIEYLEAAPEFLRPFLRFKATGARWLPRPLPYGYVAQLCGSEIYLPTRRPFKLVIRPEGAIHNVQVGSLDVSYRLLGEFLDVWGEDKPLPTREESRIVPEG